jgi:hypothetical protein
MSGRRMRNYSVSSAKRRSITQTAVRSTAVLMLPVTPTYVLPANFGNAGPSRKNTSLDDVITAISDFRRDTEKLFAGIETQLAAIAEIRQRVGEHDEKIVSPEIATAILTLKRLQLSILTQEVAHLTSQNQQLTIENQEVKSAATRLRTQIHEMKAKCAGQALEIRGLKQYTRKTCLVIVSLPQFYAENARDITKRLMGYLGIQDALLLDCHRLNQKAASNFLIKFASACDCGPFYTAAKKKVKMDHPR